MSVGSMPTPAGYTRRGALFLPEGMFCMPPTGFGGALRPLSTSAPAVPPTVSSITPDVGDTAGGGGIVTITGTNFTGATGVTIGGVACTSVIVVNPTTITCVPGAHAAAANQSVVVTTPAGSNGANTLFEYWTPSQITNVDIYLDANKGWASTGTVTWTDQSANGRVFQQATGANQPTQVASVFGSLPAIRFTPEQWVQLGAGVLFASGSSIFAVAKQPGTKTRSTITNPGDCPYTIVADPNGFGGFGISNGSIQSVHHTTVPGYATVTRGSGVNSNAPVLIGATYDTTSNTKCYLGATQQGATDVTGNYDTSNQYRAIGGSVLGDGYDGDLGAVSIVSGVISAGDLTKLNKWAQQRFSTP